MAVTARPAGAWGFEAHKFITTRAIALLPIEIRPFFQKHQAAIVEHSIDPDLWRTVGWLDEPPRHFVDMDAYGAHPFKDLPRDFDEAVKRYGMEFVVRNGTLPWRGEEIFGKLVEAFAQKAPYSRENIKLFSSVMSHYTADAHVPFHAALNYDGQLTQQWGIHSRFESDLFDRYSSTVQLAPPRSAPIAKPRDFLFDTLTASFTFVGPILEADKSAAAGRDVYDDAYFTLFFGKVKPIFEQRLAESVQNVAAMITAAWVEAGRPALAVETVAPPKRVRRQ
jgi:Zinc dependent phospholipase C